VIVLSGGLALQLVLAGAVTIEFQFVVAYQDVAHGEPPRRYSAVGVSNDTTDVVMLAAPPAGVLRREVLAVNLHCPDATGADAILKLDDGAAEYILCRKTLAQHETLVIDETGLISLVT
jgi:hypothetical protein